MSYSNTFTLHLDLKKSVTNATPLIVSNDTATLFLNVTDGGLPYDLTTADRFTITFIRPEGINITGQGIIENGLLKYQLGTNETSARGFVECVAQFYSGSTRVTTRPFKIKIIADYEVGIGSETDLTLLQELFIEVNDKGTFAQDQGNFAKTQGENLGHKGEFSSSVAYKKNNVITYGGITYICILDTTAGTLPTNATYFNVVAPQARFNSQTWEATANQTVFTLSNGTYVINSGNIEVVVGGVPQTSGYGFTETSTTSFTLSEGVSASTVVYARWVEGAFTISKTHKSTHELGGQDELDVMRLKNIDKFPKTSIGNTSPTDGSILWIDESVL